MKAVKSNRFGRWSLPLHPPSRIHPNTLRSRRVYRAIIKINRVNHSGSSNPLQSEFEQAKKIYEEWRRVTADPKGKLFPMGWGVKEKQLALLICLLPPKRRTIAELELGKAGVNEWCGADKVGWSIDRLQLALLYLIALQANP